jgi:hypothetical protein
VVHHRTPFDSEATPEPAFSTGKNIIEKNNLDCVVVPRFVIIERKKSDHHSARPHFLKIVKSMIEDYML